jgi:ring-1,2-phenylacetyl-CoA epoxidase subunit PaaE
MFIDDLFALKNRYMGRLQLHFLFSQEEQESEIASGRLNDAKLRELFVHFFSAAVPDEAFVCGPDTMIKTATESLVALGMDSGSIHSERFGAPRGAATTKPIRDAAGGDLAQITVIMDGHKKSFEMQRSGTNIVDAAAASGIELPYSCKGGVCATCRTHVRSGEVEMATNFGLERWEVGAGFVLACQSTPVSDKVLLDYDKA